MGIRALVFDFGNVIGHFSHRRATERLAPHAGVPADTLHALLFGGPLEDDYESGRISTAEFLGRVRREARMCCGDDVLAAGYADIFWPNDELCSLLPVLAQRLPLYLLSNTNDLHACRFREQFALALRPFRALVLSHEVGVRKPLPGIFDHARRLARCRPDELLFVDDLEPNVAGARACGWQAVQYTGVAELCRALGIRDQGLGIGGRG
jgi:putative hydrolase of the HAD superfamily